MNGKHQPTQQSRGSRRHKGQSLVEFALVLPLLLLIVAGALEVGNLLTNYNRMQLSAREGARFGAAGGTDNGVKEVMLQALTQTIEVDPDFLSIWIIRPVIDYNSGVWSWANSATNPPWGMDEICVYGDKCGDAFTPAQPAPVDSDDVLAEISQINQTGYTSLDGTTFVVAVVYYEVPTILNLPFFEIQGESGGRVPLSTFAIMNQEIIQASNVEVGCSAYAAVVESNWFQGVREGDIIGPIKLNDPATTYRRQGYGYLAWNLTTTEPSFLMAMGSNGASMGFPGTSRRDDVGFIEYDSVYGSTEPDDYDTGMHRGDWVIASEANNTSEASTPLNDHLDTQRDIRIIIYNYAFDTNTGTSLNPRFISFNGGPEVWQYRIDGFAIVRIHDWVSGGGSCAGTDLTCDTITFEFIRFDQSCGYEF